MNIRSVLVPLAAVALLAASSLPALASDEPEPEAISVDIIEGISWQLQRQLVDGTLTDVPDGVVVTLTMEDGTASGSGGCNDYAGPYTRDGDALSFGSLRATMMLCPDGGSDVEAAYFENLAAVATGASTGGSLVMNDAAGETILEFAPAEQRVGVFGIEDMDWILSGQLVDGQIVPVPEPLLVTLRMEDGQASGSGGCNNWFAEYRIDGFMVSFGDIGSTMMACPEPAMDVEAAYLENLAAVASYQSGGIQMAFLDAGGAIILEFDVAPPASIVGAWVATGINNGADAVVSSEVTPQVMADFGPNGELSGFDGCNRYTTTYEIDGDRIAISDMIASTRMACPSDELAEQSQWFYGALVNAASWSVDAAGRLELRDADGALQVSFAPAE